MSEAQRQDFFNSTVYRIFSSRIFNAGGAIDGGALEDLQVNSTAMNDYRRDLQNREIPVYSIAMNNHGRPSIGINLLYQFYLYAWDHRLDNSTTYFQDADSFFWLFRYEPTKVEYGLFGATGSSDFIVYLNSQKGGSSAYDVTTVTDHINEVNDAGVRNLLLSALNSPVSDFDPYGFWPSEFYPVPPVGWYDIPYRSTSTMHQQQAGHGNITITTPMNGTVFAPGENVTVEVIYEGEPYSGVHFLAQDLSFGVDNETPYSHEFTVDEEYLGPMLIAAWVVNEDGSSDEASVEIDIVTNVTPDQISTLPAGPLYLRADDEVMLYVQGMYGNISRDITFVGTTYNSSNTSVAQVNDGVLTALAVGEAVINITNGITEELHVYVLKSCEEPVNGMRIRKKLKLCPGTYNLANGIRIDIDNVVIDCNGATIRGSGSGTGIYVLDRKGITLKNCNVQNYYFGIAFNQSDNNRIVSNNVGANNFGIYLINSDRNTISDNNAFDNRYHGIFAEYSSDLNISSNILQNNGQSGVFGYGAYVRYASSAEIMDNLISDNSATAAYAIKLKAFPDALVVTNTIFQNLDNAIQIETSDNLTIIDNNIYSNNRSIYIDSSNNINIFHNNFNNTLHAFDNGNNSWDNGAVSGGNYWSNYDEETEGCNDTDNDGYCDMAYAIPPNGTDNFPFTRRNGWLKNIFTINLNSGWNLISIPLVPDNNSIQHVFASVNYTQLFSSNNGWKVPTEINNALGYWIKAADNHNLTIEGSDPGNKSINLVSGWNLIGYPNLEARNISLVFNDINVTTIFSYEDHILKSYKPDRPENLNSLRVMRPGYGYWVYVNEGGSIDIS